MNVPRNFSELKLLISGFNGWQRIWLVISGLIFIFTFFLWASEIKDPFSGFESTNISKNNLVKIEKVWNEREVDCKLNEKNLWDSIEFSHALERVSQIDERIKRLSKENSALRSSFWSYLDKEKKISSNEALIARLEEEKKSLFNTPALIKRRECNIVEEELQKARNRYEADKIIQYDPIISFLKTSFWFLLAYLLVISFLYLAGFSLGWIYRGFKK